MAQWFSHVQRAAVLTPKSWTGVHSRAVLVCCLELLLTSLLPALGFAQHPAANGDAHTLTQDSSQPTTDYIAGRLETLEHQLQMAEAARRAESAQATEHLLWLGGGIGVLFSVLIGFMGIFINSRIKEPEEWRENLRKQVLDDLDKTRVHLTAHVNGALAATEARVQALHREYQDKIESSYAAARTDAESFRKDNETLLTALRDLTSLGQPSPAEKPEAETLYYLAEQATSESGPEGRARGLRYLRRLAEPDIQAFPPLLHNAGVLSKQYQAAGLALRLFKRAYEASGHSLSYAATYAHELATGHQQDESLTLFRKLREEHPGDEEVMHSYVDALRSLKLFRQATELLDEEGPRFASSAKVTREWADLLSEMGRYDVALEKATLATQLDPGDDLAWAYRAKIAYTLRHLDIARESAREAIRVADTDSPRLPNHFRRLADIERASGDAAAAGKAYAASLLAATSPSRAIFWLRYLGVDGGGSGGDSPDDA